MDYAKIGLKCGLEIHQQLSTDKLFCSCSGDLREDDGQFKVKRYLRAVQGEQGIVDVAALHEQQKGRYFLYEGYDSTCLVELDEEPPHRMNDAALRAVLEISLLLKARVVDAIQVMRKTVVDGSNTSGFQRTALVAQSGSVGDVSITSICIEEDSARIVSNDHQHVVYRLDRLGVPLVEIGTDADITTPEQCLEVAEKIGMMLRSTGKVKRGIGTIRQDVNVSVFGGDRVEIKGAQELKLFPLLVEIEAKRQLKLLEIAKELKKRKASVDAAVDVTSLFEKSASTMIKTALQSRGVVLGMRLRGFAGFIGTEVQPGKRLGTELSDYAKVKAGVGGIFHSDELPKYGITADEVAAAAKKLSCLKDDGFVLVAVDKGRAERALAAVAERAALALKCVPREVRRANPDGTTNYLRPIPTAARMYPETDIPLVVPDVRGIVLPELIEDKVKRFVQMGLGGDLAQFVARSERVFLFEELVWKYKTLKPAFIAEILTAKTLELKRDFNVDVTDAQLREVFDLLGQRKVGKDSLLNVLVDLAKGTFDAAAYTTMSTADVERELKTIVDANKGLSFGALMGIAMSKLKGRASGKEIGELLKRMCG